MRSTRTALLLAAILAVPLAACGGGDDKNSSSRPPVQRRCLCHDEGDGGLLAQVCDKGTLTASTDAAYPPQSKLDPKTGEYVGFDIDVATEIANRLGVDIAWETPPFEAITAGHWNGRWDMSVGSITITNERAKALHFTQPYYTRRPLPS